MRKQLMALIASPILLISLRYSVVALQPLRRQRRFRSSYVSQSSLVTNLARKRPRSPRFLQQSLRVSTENADLTMEEDMRRWERMYDQGQRAATLSKAQSDSTSSSTPQSDEICSEVRVVTFDLDDTLWVTSTTIAAANEALATFLESRNVTQGKRIEVVMGELFRSNKTLYCPIETNSAKSPVLLTLLRKNAIRYVLEQENGYNTEDAIALTDSAFEVWTQARHNAIASTHPVALHDCLNSIASLRSRSGHPVVIGAITDGNSDPSRVSGLSEYFDFCINAERVGVSKPDKRLYLKAVTEAMKHPALKDIVQVDMKSSNDIGDVDDADLHEQSAENMLGPWWIHIGDDFVKDVVASKSLGMRSIWSRELVLHKFKNDEQQTLLPTTPEKSVGDFIKQVSELKVITMQVGADAYLADALQQEFADAVVDCFKDVGTLVHKWHSNALTSLNIETVGSEPPDNLMDTDDIDINRAHSARSNVVDTSFSKADTSNEATTQHKFCLFCGANLPVIARFCSSCGKQQVYAD